MLSPTSTALRTLQRLLALQLAVTLVAAHRSITAGNAIDLGLTPVRAVSPYRLLGAHPTAVLAGMVAVLLLAATGLAPRVLVPLQCWLTVWFPLQYPFLVDGGDALAAVLLVELLPFLLSSSAGTARLSRGVVRAQIALVYAVAGLTKLTVPEWRSGIAVNLYAQDPLEGVRAHFLVGLVGSPVVEHALTWGTPILECGIALAVIGRQRYRRVAFLAAVVLHASIAVAFGYYTFQGVMIAGALVLTEPWRADAGSGSDAKAADLAPQLLGEAGR